MVVGKRSDIIRPVAGLRGLHLIACDVAQALLELSDICRAKDYVDVPHPYIPGDSRFTE